MKNTYILALLFIVILNLEATSQSEIIMVWKAEIPGAIKTKEYQEKEVLKNGELQSTSHVTTPTLSIYKPAQANGTAIMILLGGRCSDLYMNKK